MRMRAQWTEEEGTQGQGLTSATVSEASLDSMSEARTRSQARPHPPFKVCDGALDGAGRRRAGGVVPAQHEAGEKTQARLRTALRRSEPCRPGNSDRRRRGEVCRGGIWAYRSFMRRGIVFCRMLSRHRHGHARATQHRAGHKCRMLFRSRVGHPADRHQGAQHQRHSGGIDGCQTKVAHHSRKSSRGRENVCCTRLIQPNPSCTG